MPGRFFIQRAGYLDAREHPAVQAFLRSDTPTGIDADAASPAALADLQALLASGQVASTPEGDRYLQEGAPGREPRGNGANAMNPQMMQTLINQMNAAAEAAHQYSLMTGVVHEPVFDGATGTWHYQAVSGPDGKPVRTQGAIWQEEQIKLLAAQQALAQMTAAGKVKDPETGQWMLMPGVVHQQLQDALDREKFEFSKQQHAAELAANPRNYIQAAMLAGSRGGLGGQQPLNQLGTPPQQLFQAPTPRGSGQGASAPTQGQGQQDGTQPPVGWTPTPPVQPPGTPVGTPQPPPGGALPQGQAPKQGQQPLQDPFARPNPALQAQAGQGQGPKQGQSGQQGQGQVQGQMGAGPGGAQLSYASQGTPDQWLPVGAAQRALLEGRTIGQTGPIPGGLSGGFVAPSALRDTFLPQKLVQRDYLSMTPSEQQQTHALASFAGYSDADLDRAIQQGLPQFRAPHYGLVA